MPEHDNPLPTGAPSPLTWILEEESHGDRQAEHALFVSFTLDIGFFEAMALGPTRAAGARVTVVGDADMSNPDPRAVRTVGRSYLAGLADCPGAFHPKLVVLAGPQRCLVAIGSGNVTLSGWQDSAELWSVFRGTPAAAPTVIGEVAAWLTSLPNHVRFSRGVADAMSAAAERLRVFPSTDIGSSHVLGNLDQSLLDQLPTGPVDELGVSAPFHDPEAAALRALVDRLQPERVTVAFQPARTVIDGEALASLLDETGGLLVVDTEDRYRHGKLIEWSIDGQRFALTGSANLSSAALCRTPATGGNCELAVLSTIDASLLPRGDSVPSTQVTSHRFAIRSTRPAGPGLLGATMTDEGVWVELKRPLTVDGSVEVSPVDLSPDMWTSAATIDKGQWEVLIPQHFAAGSRVRLTCDDHGRTLVSPIVFIHDPSQVERRPVPTGPARSRTPDQLLGDPAVMAEFLADLKALRDSLTSTSSPTIPAGDRTKQRRTPARTDTAKSLIDRCVDTLGVPLARFALGQGQPITHSSLASPAPWSEDLDSDDQAPGLDEDTAEGVDEDDGDGGSAEQRAVDPDHQRRFRRLAGELASLVPTLKPTEQLLATRLLLSLVAQRRWRYDDLSWFPLLADALAAIGDSAEPPVELEARFGSLVAVGLALLRIHAPRHERTEQTLHYRRTTTAVGHLLPAAESDLIVEYAQRLREEFGGSMDVGSIQAVADEVVQGDLIHDALLALSEKGRDAHRDRPRVIHVTGSPRNPRFAALDAIAAAEDSDVAAWAMDDNGKWILLVWTRPNLYQIGPDQAGRVLWRHYRLSQRVSPSSLAATHDFGLAEKVQHSALTHPIPEAVLAIRSLGMNPASPPICPQTAVHDTQR